MHKAQEKRASMPITGFGPQRRSQPSEQAMFAIQSYRSSNPEQPAKLIVENKVESQDSISHQVTKSAIESIVDTQLGTEHLGTDQGSLIAVQVKQMPRNPRNAQKPKPLNVKNFGNNKQESLSKPQDAVYEGATSSPHIKPEYLKARLQSTQAMVGGRTRSTGPMFVPFVQGMAITQAPIMLKPREEPRNVSPMVHKRHEEETQLKLKAFKKEVNRHHHTAVAQNSSKSRSQNSNEINKDIAAVEITAKPTTLTKKQKRPIKTLQTNAQSSLESEGNQQLQSHQINVNVNKDRRSFMETEHSGGSGMRLSTIYDNTSPARVHMQLGHATNPPSVCHSRRQRRSKMDRHSQGLLNVQIGQDQKHSSHVQLTEFLANQKIQQQLQIQMAEQQIDQGSNPSADNVSGHSIDAAKNLKVTDYNATSPQVLLPKLNTGGLINIVGGRTATNVVNHVCTQEDKSADGNAFAEMVNSTTKSEFEMATEFETNFNANVINLEQASTPANWETSKEGGEISQAERPHPFTVSQPWSKDMDRSKILVQKGRKLLESVDQSAQFSISVSGAGFDQQAPKSSTAAVKTRTKSVMQSHHLHARRLLLMANASEQSHKHGAHYPHFGEVEGFRVVAHRKQVVPNARAQNLKWKQKRNAMSKNEIKRQSTLFNNLPIIGSFGSKKDETKSREGDKRDTLNTAYVDDRSRKDYAQQQESKTITENNSFQGAVTEIIEAQSPPGQRLSTYGETMTADLSKRGQDREPTPDYPPSREVMMMKQSRETVRQLQLKREKEGISTAKARGDSQRTVSRDGALSSTQQNQSRPLLSRINRWGLQNIQIGSKEMQNEQHIFDQDRQSAHERRVATSQEQNMVSSLDGNVSMWPLRDRKNFEFRNQSQTHNVGANLVHSAQNVNDSNKPTTANEFQKRARLDQVSRLMDLGQKNTNARPNLTRSTTMYTAKRNAKRNKGQIKDIFNLGDQRSQYPNLKDIRVSRLNELGKKEDGNPLHEFNQIQEIQEKRNSILQVGGVHTKALANLNYQVKYQADIINDFACKASRFNSTDVSRPGEQQRMTLKKLIGRQAYQLPDKMKQQYREYHSPTKENTRLKTNDSSVSATSRESLEQKFHVSVMRQLLNDAKVPHANETSQSPKAIYTVPKNDSITRVIDKKRPRDVQLTPAPLEDETLLDEMSPKMDGESSIMTQHNSLLSPLCNQIKLRPKAQDNQKRILDEIALKSRQMAKINRSRTQNNRSERQSQTRGSHNKDMKEMLKNEEELKLCTLMEAKISEQESRSNPPTALLQTENKQNETLNSVRTPVKKAEGISNLHEKLDSSDVEDNQSNSQLNPMGIDEQPEHAYAEKRKSSLDLPGKVDQGAHTQSDEKFNKQQVYSHYEENPNTKSRLENFASDPALDNSILGDNTVVVGLITQARSSFQHESLTQKQQQEIEAQNDYSPQQAESQTQGKDMHAPVISVTSVKIQKAKGLFQKSEDVSATQNKKSPRVANYDQSIGASLIKHVDQSLEEQEINSGKDTVVRKSLNQSSACKNEKPQSASGQKYSSMDCIPNMSYQEISPGQRNEQEVMSVSRQHQLGNMPMETLQNASTNRDESELMTREQWQTAFLDDPSAKPVSGANSTTEEQVMRKSLQEKNGGPPMLNFISKKQEGLQSFRRSRERNGSRDPNLMNSLTLQSDILEQLNAVNSVLAPHLQANQYAQLEQKMFTTNMNNMKVQHIKRVTPSSEAPSTRFNQQNANSRLASSISRRVGSKKTSNAASDNLMAPVMKYDVPTSPPPEPDLEDEIGFVSHAAMENRLHGYQQTKLLMEQRKREWAKQQKEFTSIELQPSAHGVSVISSHQYSKDPLLHSTTAEQSQARPLLNSQNDITVIKSHKIGSISGYESIFKSRMEQELEDEQFANDNVNMRRIKKVEKDIQKCINIEKLMKIPVEQVNLAMQELIGRASHFNTHESSLCSEGESRYQFTFKPKRKGIMKLDTVILSELYKDHLIYEFQEKELHGLLGETVPQSSNSRRYFLKFTSLQIINVDCQSGIITDIEPISIPMSKMINLFFLSSDQLQQVVGQCLSLRNEQSEGLKLYLDSEQLREKIKSTTPRVIREDYYSAPLRVNLLEIIEDHNMIKDSFNVEIRLPRLEIVTTSQDTNKIEPYQPLFKTTMTHNLTGVQMMTILQKYHLLEWALFAKSLISQRTFGVDSIQVDGDASIIKFQRMNQAGELVLYMDPDQLKQEQQIAQNLQLTMAVSDSFTMHIEYLKPLYIKLQVDEQELFDDFKRDLLPGYLPESAKRKAKAKTVAFMHIPFVKLPYIKQTFGDKIQEGEGCFLECLYDMVELQIDVKRDILRLQIPSWRRLEEMNIRQLSHKYYIEQQMHNQAQQESCKYKSKAATGELKAMLGNNANLAKTNQGLKNHKSSIVSSQDHNQVSQMQTSIQESQQRSVFQRMGQRASNGVKHTAPAQQVKPPALMSPSKMNSLEPVNITGFDMLKRLQVNDMQCKLKVCRLTKAVFASEFAPKEDGSLQKELISRQDASRKVSLGEFFSTKLQEMY